MKKTKNDKNLSLKNKERKVTGQKAPKVSVLTPIYNTNPEHLREMIDSILDQTFTDFEFLILNDSPDNKEIEKIVKDYAKYDNRIKYYKNDKNIGITLSRNKLMKLASGEYFAVFDHDDISVPTRLEKEVAYLDSHPDVGVVSGWLEFFGTYEKIHKTPEHDMDIKIELTDECWIAHTAAMIRKSVLVDNNIEYEKYYSPAEDYRLWQRLMDLTHFYNFQEVLVRYRWTPTNTSNTQHDKMFQGWFDIHSEICNKHPFWRAEYEKKVEQEKKNAESTGTKFRLRLFNRIPLIKIKRDWVYLFEFIPVIKIRRN